MTTLDLEPLFSRIIVKRKEVKNVGMIIIPDNARSMQATEGMVVAVGKEVDVVKPGDTIFWGRYVGVEIERGDEKFVMMNQEDIMARVKTPQCDA